MKKINISLNPSYWCNFRCGFCYLTKDQLSDQRVMSLDVLESKLYELSLRREIRHVDLYGGEMTILDPNYVDSLIKLVRRYSSGRINLNTNLSRIPKFSLEDVDVYVSYDFSARERHEKVFNNMLMMDKPVSVHILASKELLDNHDAEEIVATLNCLSNLKGVEVKPYSSNQANDHGILDAHYEKLVSELIVHPLRKWELENENKLEDAIDGKLNSFSNDHIYLTPQGKYAVLEFDKHDREFFLELDDFDEYVKWTVLEKRRVGENEFCSKCEYSGKCLSEHLRNVVELNPTCNGHYRLIKWYETLVEDESAGPLGNSL